jgi:methyl-accepting chemotaxis protein
MRILANLKISTRLAAVLGLLVAMLLLMGGAAMWQMAAMRAVTVDITGNWLPSVAVVNTMNTNSADFRVLEFQHVLNTDDNAMAAVEKNMDTVLATFEKNRQSYVLLISSPEERKIYETFEADWKRYLQVHAQVLVFSRKNESEKARTLLEGEGKKFYDSSSDALDQLIGLNSRGASAASQDSEQAYSAARSTILSMALAATLVAVVAALWLVRSITRPLDRAVSAADSVAAGDLASRIEVDSQDEIGQLLGALQRMQHSLVQTVSSVRSNADGVAAASTQIAQGNHDLSGRTESQASALEETAASMEQLSSAVKQNADNARQANQLALSASTVAIQGGAVVGQVVETMKGINDSSKKIADIIGVIDGIAFQTNILALNAAVEAARAGEQGRGFAVVASEVRSLAGRSADAAKEIKLLISASVERVEQGTVLVDQAGTTMTEVVGSIRRVTDIMGEISAASGEQSAGVAQVGEAVTQMDQATQQNAALVEQMAAAASSLKSQADELVHAMSVFQLG